MPAGLQGVGRLVTTCWHLGIGDLRVHSSCVGSARAAVERDFRSVPSAPVVAVGQVRPAGVEGVGGDRGVGGVDLDREARRRRVDSTARIAWPGRPRRADVEPCGVGGRPGRARLAVDAPGRGRPASRRARTGRRAWPPPGSSSMRSGSAAASARRAVVGGASVLAGRSCRRRGRGLGVTGRCRRSGSSRRLSRRRSSGTALRRRRTVGRAPPWVGGVSPVGAAAARGQARPAAAAAAAAARRPRCRSRAPRRRRRPAPPRGRASWRARSERRASRGARPGGRAGRCRTPGTSPGRRRGAPHVAHARGGASPARRARAARRGLVGGAAAAPVRRGGLCLEHRPSVKVQANANPAERRARPVPQPSAAWCSSCRELDLLPSARPATIRSASSPGRRRSARGAARRGPPRR